MMKVWGDNDNQIEIWWIERLRSINHIASFPGSPHVSKLQVTKSWARSGNEATNHNRRPYVKIIMFEKSTF